MDMASATLKRAVKKVARFEKVSFEQFKEAWIKAGHYIDDEDLKLVYKNIKVPQRSTPRSSGYDFFYPGTKTINLRAGSSVLIPTGIRCVFYEDGYDLSIYPRSGLGFKYRVHLDNTVGIIDNDYFESGNEGHIMIKLSCDPRENHIVLISTGDRFAQGIIREFFLADDDSVLNEYRNGGLGSTGMSAGINSATLNDK